MKVRILWASLGLVLLLLALATGSALFYRLLFGLVAVPILGFFASVLAARRIEGGVRRLTPFLQVGDSLEERITLRNAHWWPKLLLEVQHDTRPFGRIGRIATLWPFGTATWTTSKHVERRGVYNFGELQITSRDPFGLFGRTMRLGHQQTALIYPAVVELPGFFVPSGRGWTEGVALGRTFMPSPLAFGVREYSAGDGMSRIHWPATAHTGRLMTKEFEREPSGPADAVWVVLDLDERVQAGEGPESTVEYGVTIAASIARRFLDRGRTVGAVLVGQERHVIKPGTGFSQVGRILQALALIEPGRLGSITEAASTVQFELTPGTSVVLITAASVDAAGAAAITLQTAGAAVVPILIEASSFAGNLPASGEQYRLPGADLSAYVIHMGDEIEKRLDYRALGHSLASPLPEMVARL